MRDSNSREVDLNVGRAVRRRAEMTIQSKNAHTDEYQSLPLSPPVHTLFTIALACFSPLELTIETSFLKST